MDEGRENRDPETDPVAEKMQAQTRALQAMVRRMRWEIRFIDTAAILFAVGTGAMLTLLAQTKGQNAYLVAGMVALAGGLAGCMLWRSQGGELSECRRIVPIVGAVIVSAWTCAWMTGPDASIPVAAVGVIGGIAGIGGLIWAGARDRRS